MTIAFDVNDQGVEIQFAPAELQETLPPNRVALTGMNRQNILRMRGVAGGGALTSGRSGATHPAWMVLKGVPQDRVDDGADMPLHERLKLELAVAFGSEITQMGDVVQAIMAAIGPDSKLDAAQKMAVQDVVRDLITLKTMMNTGQVPPAQMVQVAQGLLEKLVTTLQPVSNLPAPILPPALAQFAQKLVQQVAAQTNAPVLTTAIERLAPLMAVVMATAPTAPIPTPLVATPVWAAGLSQGAGIPLSALMPSIPQGGVSSGAKPTADAAPTAAAPATHIQHSPVQAQPHKPESVIPVVVAAAVITNPVHQSPVQTAPSQVSAPVDAPRPVTAVAEVAEVTKPAAPAATVQQDTKQTPPVPANTPAAQPSPVAVQPTVSDKQPPPAPAQQTPPVVTANVPPADVQSAPRQSATPASPQSSPPDIAVPLAAAVITAPAPKMEDMIRSQSYTLSGMTPMAKGACGKANCDCGADFRAVSGKPFEVKAALIADLGDKTATAILAKHGGDIQKAAEYVATEQKAQERVIAAIDKQMQASAPAVQASQAVAMAALAKSLSTPSSGTTSAFSNACADGTCGHDHHKPAEPPKGEKVKKAKFDRSAYKPKSM